MTGRLRLSSYINDNSEAWNTPISTHLRQLKAWVVGTTFLADN